MTELIDDLRDLKISRLAEIVHEANRAYCKTQGDLSQVPWDELDLQTQESVKDGVDNVLKNPEITPEQSHENWVKFKSADGWVYGEVKDPELKTHPCILPYDRLPSVQRFKDTLLLSIVKGYIEFVKVG